MSRWNDESIRERAQYVRTGRNKGVRRAIAEAKRAEAETRNAATQPERRRSARRAAGGAS